MQSRVQENASWFKFNEHKLIDLTDRIERDTAVYCGGGRFGDVYKCRYREPSGSSKFSVVAVKSVRYFVSSREESEAINKDLRRELGLWRRLDFDHQNIVPLLGVAKGFGPLDAIVSTWMPNGTLHSFLKDAGKKHIPVQRLSILHEIASCLEYLHSIPVVHGDLTSCNILIDEEHKPRLTDFGLSSALGRLQPGMTYLNRCSADPGAIRWAAPELFDDECELKPSADMYSFGCIMLEVLSGNIPWQDKPERVVIGLKIVHRKFPDRPAFPELDDGHWALTEMCWSLPDERPSAQQVVRYLTDLRLADLRGNPRVREAIRCDTDCTRAGKKRALLIAVQYVHSKSDIHHFSNLHLVHRDARALRCDLMSSHGYHAEDIVLMIDDKHHPKHLWPTRDRILQQIDQLVSGAPDNGHFFFHFGGHGVLAESEGTNKRRPEIVTADGSTISDLVLHERLVTPLTKVNGSKLFALFDCCHSGTLLDLQLGDGPKTYSRKWEGDPGRYFKAIALSIVQFLRLSKKHRRHVDLASPGHDAIQPDIPIFEPLPVTRVESDTQGHRVISLSACRYIQSAHVDYERGLTFTKFFLDALATRPNLSWVDLREELIARISEMLARCKIFYIQGRPAEDDSMNLVRSSQVPRYSTTPYTDLTKPVEL